MIEFSSQYRCFVRIIYILWSNGILIRNNALNSLISNAIISKFLKPHTLIFEGPTSNIQFNYNRTKVAYILHLFVIYVPVTDSWSNIT